MLRNEHMEDLAHVATKGIGESLFGPRPYVDPVVDMEIWALIEFARSSPGYFAPYEIEWAWGLASADEVREGIARIMENRARIKRGEITAFTGLRELLRGENHL